VAVRPAILPNKRIRLRITPRFSDQGDSGRWTTELVESSTDAVMRRGLVMTIGGRGQTSEIWRRLLIGCERVNRMQAGKHRPDGRGDMTESRVARGDDLGSAGMLWWAATWRRWLAALNAFLEQCFRQADVETGC
jgi:hypothetical protein